MKNEAKADELGKKYGVPYHGIGECEFKARQSAIEMAEWKDEQNRNQLVDILKSLILSEAEFYNLSREKFGLDADEHPILGDSTFANFEQGLQTGYRECFYRLREAIKDFTNEHVYFYKN